MTAEIPQQLQNPAFRFCLLNKPDGTEKSKRAFEKNWETKANYAYDNPKLLKWLAEGGNVGVVCGYGGLRVLDLDISKDDRGEDYALKNADKVFDSAPSFAVRSAHGGLHIYYICHKLPEGWEDKAYVKLPHNAGEFRLRNCYVVCPPSRIDPPHTYTVWNAAEITVSKEII